MAEHTPSLWTLIDLTEPGDEPEDPTHHRDYAITGPDGQQIISPRFDDDAIVIMPAHAHLIAAAPEMLAVCREMRDLMRDIVANYGGEFEEGVARQWAEKIDAVMARAEGRA